MTGLGDVCLQYFERRSDLLVALPNEAGARQSARLSCPIAPGNPSANHIAALCDYVPWHYRRKSTNGESTAF